MTLRDRLHSRTPSTQRISASDIHGTSPTIPLGSSQLSENSSRGDEQEGMDVDELEGSMEPEGGGVFWPNLVASPTPPPRPESPKLSHDHVGGDEAMIWPPSPGVSLNEPSDLQTDDQQMGTHDIEHAIEDHQAESPSQNSIHSPTTPVKPSQPVASPHDTRFRRSLPPNLESHSERSASVSFPSPSHHVSPGLSTSPRVSDSPLVEAQLGPHNVRDWRPRSISQAAAKDRSHSPSPVILDVTSHIDNLSPAPSAPYVSDAAQSTPNSTSERIAHIAVLPSPSSFYASIPREPSHSPSLSPDPLLLDKGSSQRDNDKRSSQTPIPSHRRTQPRATPASYLAPPSPLPSPASIPADPALEQFRTARTFRTRTKLQLQPYTKERQIYEAALRRGGLKKGKHAIASAREITPGEEDNGAEEGQMEPSSDAFDEGDPERIVIGGTPPLSQERQPRPQKELIDTDFDEYFLQFGTPANASDDLAATRLQKIARQRIKDQKAERRKKREEERQKKEFEALIRAGPGGQGLEEGSGDEVCVGICTGSDRFRLRIDMLSPSGPFPCPPLRDVPKRTASVPDFLPRPKHRHLPLHLQFVRHQDLALRQ